MTTRKRKRPRGSAASAKTGKACVARIALVVAGLLLVASPARAEATEPGAGHPSTGSGCPEPVEGQGAPPTINDIRVHGNYSTPDSEVARLAGLTLGQALEPASLELARARLQRSGRFVAVDIRKRYRSLDDETDVAVVIVVQEYPVPDAAPSPLRPLRRTFRSAMFMPVLDFTDGYGLTYGGRVSFVDGLGKSARLSVPLTWGGTKRAAAEFRKTIARGPVDTIDATVSISRRTNPHYEMDDDRRGVLVGTAGKIAGPLRAEGHVGVTAVTFGNADDRFVVYGGGLALDTRADPVFPRNAVFAAAGWERLEFRQGVPVNRLRLDARGYLGLVGQTVLSLRAQFARADRPLPPYERFLVGGADSLRGYRAGTFAGDTLAAASAELRVPLDSPLSFARTGLDGFVDVGTAFDRGTRLSDAAFHPGFGAGAFLIASIFQINADVAVRRGGGVRLHVMSGFRF
jgi:outer membrane protein assembly factor BamA